jgi:hypothetical protein
VWAALGQFAGLGFCGFGFGEQAKRCKKLSMGFQARCQERTGNVESWGVLWGGSRTLFAGCSDEGGRTAHSIFEEILIS